MYVHTHKYTCAHTQEERDKSKLLSRSKFEWLLPGHGIPSEMFTFLLHFNMLLKYEQSPDLRMLWCVEVW